MFGISFTEIMVIALVALVVVGPQKLPKMLRTLGEWIGKLRSLTTQVRRQTGIDEILRGEGIEGGLSELRGILRGDLSSVGRTRSSGARSVEDPYDEPIEYDRSREYPVEGPDAYGALPDDLAIWDDVEDVSVSNDPTGAPAGATAADSPQTGSPQTGSPQTDSPQADSGARADDTTARASAAKVSAT